jgi:hypothetical protein
MPYTYDRTAADPARTPYSDSLTAAQEQFVGNVGAKIYWYVDMLHKRLSRRPPYSELYGFTGWDYGPVESRGTGTYSQNIYLKSGDIPDLGPRITLYVKFDNSIEIIAKADNGTLWKKKLSFNTKPIDVAMGIGEAWEKALTGSVDYGD